MDTQIFPEMVMNREIPSQTADIDAFMQKSILITGMGYFTPKLVFQHYYFFTIFYLKLWSI